MSEILKKLPLKTLFSCPEVQAVYLHQSVNRYFFLCILFSEKRLALPCSQRKHGCLKRLKLLCKYGSSRRFNSLVSNATDWTPAFKVSLVLFLYVNVYLMKSLRIMFLAKLASQSEIG